MGHSPLLKHHTMNAYGTLIKHRLLRNRYKQQCGCTSAFRRRLARVSIGLWVALTQFLHSSPVRLHLNTTGQLDKVIMLQICTRKVIGSYLGMNTDYPDIFPRFLKTNFGILYQMTHSHFLLYLPKSLFVRSICYLTLYESYCEIMKIIK